MTNTIVINAGLTPLPLYVNNELIQLRQSEVAITPANALVSLPKQSEEIKLIQMVVSHELIRDYSVFSSSLELPALSLQKLAVIKNLALAEIVLSFLPYFNNKELICEKLLKVKLFEFLFLLQKTSSGIISSGSPDNTNGNLTQLLLQHLYRSDISVSRMAALSGMSVSTFKRKFKDSFTVPLRQWVISRRLERALCLLNSTSMSIKEIAFTCGFTSSSYFIRQFKRTYGKTPNNCRYP